VKDHPAVKAWAAATSQTTAPEYILVFRERKGSALYGLPALGGDGVTVIAKRSPAPLHTTERLVYEAILPNLPVTTPRCYGALPNGEHGWIFVEHVGTDRYRQDEPEHRALAARWLATMHTEAVWIAASESLPIAGPARYLEQLRAGRDRILHSLESWSFDPSEVEVLNATASYCDAIERRWDRVLAICREVPSTLVHCDFRPKNAFVKRDSNGLSLWPIDWEMAGFGLPAADLTRIDLRTYWSTIQPDWPHVTFETVESLASAGHVLQWVAAIDWESASLMCARKRDRSHAVADVQLSMHRLAKAAHSARVME
jgi:aminoglycoside phosphotransferase (APT) family kinase protein